MNVGSRNHPGQTADDHDRPIKENQDLTNQMKQQPIIIQTIKTQRRQIRSHRREFIRKKTIGVERKGMQQGNIQRNMKHTQEKDTIHTQKTIEEHWTNGPVMLPCK